MDRHDVERWVRGYETAWRTAGTDRLTALFTEDASYQHSPYDSPLVGLAAIAADWEEQREGPDEAFELAWAIVAVDGPVAVVRAEVRYGDPVVQEYRDLWVLDFAADGRCRRFEEWPFWPAKGWSPHQPHDHEGFDTVSGTNPS
jgi:ketosteroid isomerase-like protein